MSNAAMRLDSVEFVPSLVVVKPSVSVIGLGYVGAVTTGCLSRLGHRIVGVDIDPAKVEAISQGRSPMHEEGLDQLLTNGVAAGLVEATGDIGRAVAETDVTFISVGTPTADDGSCDLRGIEAAADAIGRALRTKPGFHVVVLRCSVPPGTTLGVMAPRITKVSGKEMGVDFGIGFVPEFMREGVAIADFDAPPKTVIGASDPLSSAIVARIFEPVDPEPVHADIETAELVKYVDNVWHAAKVCFANEVGRLAKAINVDGRGVMDIFCKDTKLNLSPYYLKPGFAYGGSCLPKEVRAVSHLAGRYGIDLPMVNSLAVSNEAQIGAAMKLVRDRGAQRVGVLGLAFKAGTDDLRESPIMEVVARLLDQGTEVRAHDSCLSPKPCANDARPGAPRRPRVGVSEGMDRCLDEMLTASPRAVVEWADIVLVTHDLPLYRELLRGVETPVVDLVGLFDRNSPTPAYEGIGW